MKRSCLTIMALFTIAILTSFVNMRGRKEDKSIEALWEDFRKAEQLDQINKMADILEDIKTKAHDKRASWDFYKAWDNYVDVKSRKNWKLRDTLETQMKTEVEEYDEPLLTYLLNRVKHFLCTTHTLVIITDYHILDKMCVFPFLCPYTKHNKFTVSLRVLLSLPQILAYQEVQTCSSCSSQHLAGQMG